jgi:hypothetical protein
MEYVRDGLVLKSVAIVGEVNSASYTKGQEVIEAKPATPSSNTNKPRKKYYQDPWNF